MTDDDRRAWMRACYPDRGPAWEAAIEAGVDVFRLEANLQLTPEQRLMDLQFRIEREEEIEALRAAKAAKPP